jgi:hypothetical protein
MEFMTANWPPERNLRSSDRAAGNALEALQKPHPFRLMTGRFNLDACSNRTTVDRPALVLSQCKEFLSVSNTTLFMMFSMERQFDVGLSEQLPKDCRGRATCVLAGRNSNSRDCIVNHAEHGFPSAAGHRAIITGVFGDRGPSRVKSRLARSLLSIATRWNRGASHIIPADHGNAPLVH